MEAAIVLPLYMMAVISLISIIQMYKTYETVSYGLLCSGKEVALYIAGQDLATKIDSEELKNYMATAISDSYVAEKVKGILQKDSVAGACISGGARAVNTLLSKITVGTGSRDIIDLVITYRMEPAADIFGIGNYAAVNRLRLHPWTGYEGGAFSEEEDDRIVYITETGEVYHLSRSCSHLNLSIHEVSADSLESLRNSSGGKYKPCENCKGEGENVYITDDGDRYHSSLSCSGLKRTIIEIKYSEVGDRRACSGCGR